MKELNGSIQHFLAVCCASRDGYAPDPSWRRSSGRPKTTLITSLSTLALHGPIHFSLAQIVRSRGQLLRLQRRMWLTDLEPKIRACERPTCLRRSALKLIFVTPALRSVVAPRPPTPRSAPVHPVFCQLRSISSPLSAHMRYT